MFSEGGAFTNAYRFLVKSALTAFALIAATFTANAAEVISINFTRIAGSNSEYQYGILDNDTVYSGILSDQITGAAWNTITGPNGDGTSGNKYLTKYWNGIGAATLSENTVQLTWNAYDFWHDGNRPDFMQGYLDDTSRGPVVGVTGIEYPVYDLIIYCNGEGARPNFHPFNVNGVWYTHDGNGTIAGSSSWGLRQNDIAEGKNALRITGLSGNLSIQGKARSGSLGGCIAAIQIVKSDGQATKPTVPDFSFGPKPPTATGWFTAWDGLGSHRMVGPEGVDVFLADGGPWQKFDCAANAVTIAAIINADNVTLGANEAALLSYGRTAGTSNGLLLTKAAGQDGYTLKLYHTGDKVNSVSVTGVGEGFHLVVVTFANGENNSTISLKVDGRTPVTETLNGTFQFDAEDEGMQIAESYGGAAPNGMPLDNGYGVAFDRILGWNGALNADQQATLYGAYSSLLTNPMALTYTTDYNNGADNGADGKIYMPSMKGDYSLRGSRGTVEIPAASKIEVPSILFGNVGNSSYTLTVNIAGSILVTSDSGTQYHVWNDRDNKKGVLLAHWTTGQTTINLTGTLAATNAFTQVEQQAPTQLNIDGGTLTTRGLFARRDTDGDGRSAAISLTNGGTLEFARFVGPADRTDIGGDIPLTVGEGTIRAIQSGTYTTGWTYPSAVTFTNETTGTTLDPNGLTISFTGAASGAGKIIVNDTSANANGTVTIANADGITGTFSVVNGALYLPDTYVPRLAEGTDEDTQGAITGYKKYVNSSYVAQPVARVGANDYYTVTAAIASLDGAAGTITLLANVPAEDVTLGEGQAINTDGFAIGTVTAANGAVVGLVGGVYTAYAANEGEEWTGNGSDNKWTTAANWSLGFVPVATTPVTFNSAATVGIDDNSRPTDQCASLTLNADVTLERGKNDWVELYLNGNISGAGTLTLNQTCLHNNTQTKLTISCPLVIATAEKDSNLRGSSAGWTVANTLAINSDLKTENGPVDVTGTTTIGTGAAYELNKPVTFGAVMVADSTTFPNNANVVLNGAVTVAAGKTLTVSANNVIGENASFVLAGAGATIVDNKGTIDAVSCTSAEYAICKIDDNTWTAAVAWTGADGGTWGTAGNWSNNKIPDANTPVVFTNDVKVSLGGSGAKGKCVWMGVDGNVEFSATGDNAEVELHGAIAGSGKLTLIGCGLKNMSGKNELIVAPEVIFKADASRANYPPWLAGYQSIKVTGDVTFVDRFKSWDATHTITGTTTLSGPTFDLADGAGLKLGAVTVPANVTVTRNKATLTFGGKTTIAAHTALEIPNDSNVVIGDDATFELAGFGATLVDVGGRIVDDKVTTPIVKGAKISITTDGSKKTYKLSLVGMTIILR